MGRPPCCDKVGVKKGPWTPEEDALLGSFVEEHGPGNWRAVPTKKGLKRCSKSCRLRWTNYLRPGIKRGTFTDSEEKMIVRLQALLGNKWASIASYLPERTDNDIKNYWNTHLKKKLKKLENGSGAPTSREGYSRGQWERRLQADINTAKQALHDALSIEENTTNSLSDQPCNEVASSYASSTENIARFLQNWVKNTPKSDQESKISSSGDHEDSSSSNKMTATDYSSATNCSGGVDLSEAFESLFGIENSSNSDDLISRSSSSSGLVDGEVKPDPDGLALISVLENWLLDYQEDYLTTFSFDENPNLF